MKMKDIKKGFFGQIAIGRGFLTQEKLEECLEEQKMSGFTKRIGEICVAKGYLTEEQVQTILAEQKALATSISHPQVLPK